MRSISNKPRSPSFGEISWEDGDSKSSSEDNIIYKANSVSLLDLFKYYQINLELNKTNCPFRFNHKNNFDKSASFVYYPETNTFHCFGCNAGSRPVDLVSTIEKCSRLNAASKILDKNLSFLTIEPDNIDVSEQFQLKMKFSTSIHDFFQNHKSNEDIIFIENITKIFDKYAVKDTISNFDLENIISILGNKIKEYK